MLQLQERVWEGVGRDAEGELSTPCLNLCEVFLVSARPVVHVLGNPVEDVHRGGISVIEDRSVSRES